MNENFKLYKLIYFKINNYPFLIQYKYSIVTTRVLAQWQGLRSKG